MDPTPAVMEDGPDGKLTGYVYVVIRKRSGAASLRLAVRNTRREARDWLDAHDDDPALLRESRIRRARLTVF